MLLKSNIEKLAKKLIEERKEIRGIVILDQQGLVIHSSLTSKAHSELFSALSTDIFQEVKEIGEELGLKQMKILRLGFDKYILHIFNVKEFYILLLKVGG